MADLCVPELGCACIAYLFSDDMCGGQIAATRHAEAERQALLEALARDAFTTWRAGQALHHVAFTRRPLILSPLETAELIGDGRPAHVLQSDLHTKTAALVPVVNGEHVLGVTVFLADSTYWYTPRVICLASELCDRFALAVTAAKMYGACKLALDSTQELLATAVHDLMSPLTYIKGSAQRLRRLEWSHTDQTMSSEVDKRLTAIDTAVMRMSSAMSALVATSRAQLETHDTPNLTEMTDLAAVARETIGLEQLIAPGRILHLTQSTTEPLQGTWDHGQIQRMLANIISNALKYSPSVSSVEIQLGSEVDDAGRWAVVSVADEGIGIPANDLPFVFEPFHRGSNIGTVAGTGLGLASVWQTIKTHKGQIGVHSEEASGTRITVRLPMAHL